MSILYIVGTPIGNLKDITLRALEILKEVDFILTEDTRKTKILLDHYQIKKPLISYHQHSKLKKINFIVDLLKKEKNLALVSEAGTPGISDPGSFLINEVIKNLKDKVKIIPIPGPCALIAALSISGFPTDKFIFLGFPPNKRKRKKFFENLISAKYPVVFYESPYRILKTLDELKSAFISRKDKKLPEIIVCRELTKKFETVYRGTIDEVIVQIKNDKILGEFVIIVNQKRKND